ncbi:hypothetical protein HY628_03190 [Candidatus Uhrbacteria bacterium]|nr:hypothetical protein [Candidatus Uhrbacteria bacterium]
MVELELFAKLGGSGEGRGVVISTPDEREAVRAAIAACRTGDFSQLGVLESFNGRHGWNTVRIRFNISDEELDGWYRKAGRVRQ